MQFFGYFSLYRSNKCRLHTINNNSEFTACGMSFTYKRKSNGPNIEPRGTPQDSLPVDEDSLPTFTIKDLFVRYDVYHAIVFPAKPRQLVFSKRML